MDKVQQKKEKSYSEKAFFKGVIRTACEKKMGFALWKNPQSAQKNILAGYPRTFQFEDINTASGFVFCPYNVDDRGVLLVPHYQAAYLNKPILSSDNDEAWYMDTALQKKNLFYHNEQIEGYCKEKEEFLHYVKEGISAIRSNQIQKLVPSRTRHIELSENFSPVETFLNLCDTYPNAFVSLVSMPETGTWIGASPELLIQVQQKQLFKTVALAGTQQYDPDKRPSMVAWTQKEIEEQAMVSRYIINCFKKIRLREFEEIGPKTVRAGNLVHLKTTFEVDMAATNFHDLGAVMLQLLHPTSAVCGMPRDKAAPIITQHEGNKRGYYSGFLGPVNMADDTSIFVNLRCMQLSEKQATLYAGAGLTEDSHPENEWKETELKMSTLLDVITNN